MFTFFAQGNRWIIIWLFFILLRLFFALFSHSYIHPDEYFQSAEVVAFDMFSWFTENKTEHLATASSSIGISTPWEFDKSGEPCIGITKGIRFSPWEFDINSGGPFIRAILPLYLFMGFPIYIVYKFFGTSSTNISPYLSRYIWTSYRLSGFLWSLLLDFILWKLLSRKNGKNNSVNGLWMIIFASMWPILILQTRPLSNSLESILLALLFYFVEIQISSNSIIISVIIGMCWSLGIWSRVTFAVFSFPIMIYLLLKTFSSRPLASSLKSIFLMGFGALICSIACIVVDTLYYNTKFNDWSDIVITPFNFLIFNQDLHNLKRFGIHSRYLIVLIIMPFLFGPFYLILLKDTLNICINFVSSYSKSSKPIVGHLSIISLITIWFSSLSLSTIPHQEYRFLLPLMLPLILSIASPINFSSKYIKKFLFLFIIFQIAICLILGVFHQAGLSKLLIEFEPQDTSPCMFIFSKVYLLPTHLLIGKIHRDSIIVNLMHQDLTIDRLKAFIQKYPTSNVYHLVPGHVKLEFQNQMDLIASHFPFINKDFRSEQFESAKNSPIEALKIHIYNLTQLCKEITDNSTSTTRNYLSNQ